MIIMHSVSWNVPANTAARHSSCGNMPVSRKSSHINAHYYETVTGELNEAAQTYQRWIASYPRTAAAYTNLCNLYNEQGQYEKAMEACHESFRLGSEWGYVQLINSLLALQRFDEARAGDSTGATEAG